VTRRRNSVTQYNQRFRHVKERLKVKKEEKKVEGFRENYMLYYKIFRKLKM
jgi:hypothetical protein